LVDHQTQDLVRDGIRFDENSLSSNEWPQGWELCHSFKCGFAIALDLDDIESP
jgi:hypothetical protein